MYKINGLAFEFQQDLTILQAAKQAGFDIPTLCYMEGLKPEAGCRICVCKVAGRKTLVAACSTPLEDNMEIITYDDEIHASRKATLELMMSQNNCDCTTCIKQNSCELLKYIKEYNADVNKYSLYNENRSSNQDIDTSNEFYVFDPSKCILCRKCVNTCSSLVCNYTLSVTNRGSNTKITPPFLIGRGDSNCVSCGNCVAACPTAALYSKKAKYEKGVTPYIKSICPYCGVGCSIKIYIKDNEIVGIDGDQDGVNKGLLCVKGRFAYEFVNHPDRLNTPYIKKNGKLVPCSWNEALDAVVVALTSAKAKGSKAVAGLSSARCTNEENYLFQKFMRSVCKTNNVDHCARLCHASTVTGLAATFGSGAMTGSIDDVDGTEVILVTGSNTTHTHPVIGSRIRKAVKSGAKLIVCEPRKIDLCQDADLFLQIKPGSNVALFNAIIKIIIDEGLLNKKFIENHTQGFEEFKSNFDNISLDEYADICGVKKEQLISVARTYAKAKTAAVYYAMGVTQHSHGTDGVMTIANLAMLCGHIGKTGSGVNPLRGQNNVQGACDMGALPTDYPGYQKVANPDVIKKFESAWNTNLVSEPGLTSTEIIDKFGQGEIEFLYIMGENPIVTEPDVNHTTQSLSNGKFLLVQDIFMTETAQYADVILPALSFAQKDGTFTNTERRIQKINKAVKENGQAKTDWDIICTLAKLMGFDGFEFNNTSEIMDEIASLTPSYGGVSHKRLENNTLQWPCPDKNHPGTPLLHKDGNFTIGKGKFIKTSYVPPADEFSDAYPLTLTTGRLLYQYHSGTMTMKSDDIMAVAAEMQIEINPLTAQKYNLSDGQKALISSKRGQVEGIVKICDSVKDDVIFAPFHFGKTPINKLTARNLDAAAKIPEFKVSRVSIKGL